MFRYTILSYVCCSLLGDGTEAPAFRLQSLAYFSLYCIVNNRCLLSPTARGHNLYSWRTLSISYENVSVCQY